MPPTRKTQMQEKTPNKRAFWGHSEFSASLRSAKTLQRRGGDGEAGKDAVRGKPAWDGVRVAGEQEAKRAGNSRGASSSVEQGCWDLLRWCRPFRALREVPTGRDTNASLQ